MSRPSSQVPNPSVTTLPELPLALQAVSRERPVRAGEILFRQGERPRSVLFVLSGELRLVRQSAGGDEIILQRSRAGFIAEASLWSPHYHCDVMVAQSGLLLEIPRPTFAQVLEHDPEFQHVWMLHLAREVRRLRAQCERLSLHGAAERVIHYIESEGEQGTVILGQSRKAWARELGLSHEALYRTLRRLRQEGVIALGGDRLSLKGKA